MSNSAAEWYAEQEQRERVKAAATESEQAAEYWLKRAATMHRNAVEALTGEIKPEDLRAADLIGETAQAVHAAAERMRRGEELAAALTAHESAYSAIVAAAEQAARMEEREAQAALCGKRAPIIAVDFDGTLCESAWPDIGAPKTAVIQVLQHAQEAGARLILWTNRVGARLREAVEWSTAHGLTFDAVNENLPETKERFVTDCRKVYADIYLDDKATQPTGAALAAIWRAAEEQKEQPQAYNPAHRGAITAEQFEAIWNDEGMEDDET